MPRKQRSVEEIIGKLREAEVALARIHRRTPMDGVRAAEGGG